MRTERHSQWAFAASLLAIGMLGIVQGDAVAVWAPLSKSVPAREVLSSASAVVSLVCGAGLFIPRAATLCSRGLFFFLLIWLCGIRVPLLHGALLSAVSWESLGEIVVVLAGAWTLSATTAPASDSLWASWTAGRRARQCARCLYGLAMVAFGTAHFAYVRETASLIPPWIPAPTAWVYLTGGTYVGAGIALLAGRVARIAAGLSALQMGLFSLLVWVPLVHSHPRDAGQWSELLLSFALAASGWVIADSLRGPPAAAGQLPA